MSSKRDKLRNATLGVQPVFKSEFIEYNGQKYEMRQPTIKSRAELRDKCIKSVERHEPKGTNKTENSVDVNIFEFLVWSVIQNTFVPGTDERVFTEEDYDVLVSNPTGGFMDEFSEVASAIVNVKSEEVKKR